MKNAQPPKAEQLDLIVFSAPTIMRCGDGYMVTPGKPVRYVRVKQAAKELGMHPQTVRRMLRAKLLNGYRAGKRVFHIEAASIQRHRQRDVAA